MYTRLFCVIMDQTDIKKGSIQMNNDELDLLKLAYSDVRKEIIEAEKMKASAPIACLAFIGVVLGFLYSEAQISQGSWKFKIALMIIPFITLLGFYIFSMASRMSAILQGHAAYLEMQLNDLVGKKHLVLYSKFIDDYISTSNFKTNRILPKVFIATLIVANIIVFYIAYRSIASFMQGVFIAFSFVLCCVSFAVIAYDCETTNIYRNNAANFGNSNSAAVKRS